VTAAAVTKAHLAKAEEFLQGAQFCFDLELWDAAASNAVSAAINASDVLILRGGGAPPSGQDHAQASVVLRRMGYADEANQLNRALRHKKRAQYDSARSTATHADEAIRMAERLVDKAKDGFK
jgi:uncharacterized protein (UPF0332 family)